MATEFIVKKVHGWMPYIEIPEGIVAQICVDGNRRAIFRVNDVAEFHCAIVPKKGVGHIVQIGPAICKELDIQSGTIISATFRIDDTPYQFSMPEEFHAVLETDSEAHRIFHSLTAGNQRGLIYLVAAAKSTEKRIEKALKIAERIKDGITSPRMVLK